MPAGPSPSITAPPAGGWNWATRAGWCGRWRRWRRRGRPPVRPTWPAGCSGSSPPIACAWARCRCRSRSPRPLGARTRSWRGSERAGWPSSGTRATRWTRCWCGSGSSSEPARSPERALGPQRRAHVLVVAELGEDLVAVLAVLGGNGTGALPAVHLVGGGRPDEAVRERDEVLVGQDLVVARKVAEPVHGGTPHTGGPQVPVPLVGRALREGGLEDLRQRLLVRVDVLEAGEALVGEQPLEAQRVRQRRPLVGMDDGDREPTVRRRVGAVQRRGVLPHEAGHALPGRRDHPDRQQLEPQHRLQLRGADEGALAGLLPLDQARHDGGGEVGAGEDVAHRTGRVVRVLRRRGVVHEAAERHADGVLAWIAGAG